LNRYTAGEIEAVDVLYNTYQGAGAYTPEVKRVIPPDLPPGTQGDTEELWPPPIIDTNPARLREQVGQQWTTVTLYRLLIDSATAEHSARYQIMENATQNTQRLIEELTLAVQNARKQAITQEMQELAAGAGLISPD
jgi:F-type H+-transporting ATPase subunit gamma